MKEITILLTRYSDWISSFVYHVAGHGYTHASLSLGGGIYYSFNYRGFCEETLEKHRRRGVEQSLSCVLLAIPGFGGWIAPYFLYRTAMDKKARQVQPFIEAKLEEIYQICEKGHSLL